jgi:hypothetical protein
MWICGLGSSASGLRLMADCSKHDFSNPVSVMELARPSGTWQQAFDTLRGVSFRSPYRFYLLTVGVEVVYFHFITLRHTPQWVGLLWTRDRPVAEAST